MVTFSLLLLLMTASQPHLPRENTTVVFSHGEGGYACIRIPSIVHTEGVANHDGSSRSTGILVAFAECRRHTGDGCTPTNTSANTGTPATLSQTPPAPAIDICAKRSTDQGAYLYVNRFIVNTTDVEASKKNWLASCTRQTRIDVCLHSSAGVFYKTKHERMPFPLPHTLLSIL